VLSGCFFYFFLFLFNFIASLVLFILYSDNSLCIIPFIVNYSFMYMVDINLKSDYLKQNHVHIEYKIALNVEKSLLIRINRIPIYNKAKADPKDIRIRHVSLYDEDFHCLQSIHPISSTTSIVIYTSSRYDCNNVSVIFTCICPCYSGISPL
jgi:hypothetical protein